MFATVYSYACSFSHSTVLSLSLSRRLFCVSDFVLFYCWLVTVMFVDWLLVWLLVCISHFLTTVSFFVIFAAFSRFFPLRLAEACCCRCCCFIISYLYVRMLER